MKKGLKKVILTALVIGVLTLCLPVFRSMASGDFSEFFSFLEGKAAVTNDSTYPFSVTEDGELVSTLPIYTYPAAPEISITFSEPGILEWKYKTSSTYNSNYMEVKKNGFSLTSGASGFGGNMTDYLTYSVRASAGDIVEICYNQTDYNYTSDSKPALSMKGFNFTELIEEGKAGDNLDWQFYASGTLIIEGTGDMYSTWTESPWAEYGSQISKVEIGSGVTDIGNYAFANCTALEYVKIPGSVVSIGEHAFEGCTGLKKLIVEKGITAIGATAFSNCGSLKNCYYQGASSDWTENPFAANTVLSAVVHYSTSKGTAGDNITWHLFDDGYLYISGTGEIPDYTNGGAPWYSDRTKILSVGIGKGVTRVGNYAFSACLKMVSAELEADVKVIGAYVFSSCSALQKVSMTDNVYSIGSSAFSGCTKLSDIVLPEGLQSISSYSFSNCSSLVSIVVPASVKKIYSGAFSECTKLQSVTLKEGLQMIGSSAFYGCSKLTDITIPASVTELESSIFNKCTSLENIVIPKGIQTLYDSFFSGCTSLKDVTLPKSLKTMQSYVFSGCTSLEEIDIPKTVQSIGGYAFYNCSALTGVTLPDNLTTLSISLFYGCKSLKSIIIPEGIQTIGSSAFYGCTALTEMEIPVGVQTIGSSVFSGCTNLKTVTLSEGISAIPSYLFENCSALESISIPEGVESIGAYAFSGCTALTEFTITEQIETIFYAAFYGCSLKSLFVLTETAPDMPLQYEMEDTQAFGHCTIQDVYYIGDSAFDKITGQKNHYKIQYGTVGDAGKWVLDSCGFLMLLGEGNIPDFSQGKAPWYDLKDSVKYVVADDGITGIGSYCIEDCVNLEKVILPESIQSIAQEAFEGSTENLDLYFGGSEEKWTEIEFDLGEDILLHYYISCGGSGDLQWILDTTGELRFFGEGAMADYKVAYRELPGEYVSVTSSQWGNYFDQITSVKIEKGAASIGAYAFCRCRKLTDLEIPGTVQTIGSYAFSGNSSLEKITIPSGVTGIGEYAFGECYKLKTVTISEGVQSIGVGAFIYCYNLTKIYLPKSLRLIDTNAFVECYQISRVYYAGSKDEWAAVTINTGNDYILEANIHFGPSDEVVDLNAYIKSIGEVKYTEECWEKICSAFEQYAQIDPEEKTLVTEYSTLLAAERAFYALEQEDNPVDVVLYSRMEGGTMPVAFLTGGGSYGSIRGKDVVITADGGAEGWHFIGWYQNYTPESNGTLYSEDCVLHLTPAVDITLTAVYQREEGMYFEVTVSADNYTITGASGTQSDTNIYEFAPGTEVTVTYTDPDRVLVLWQDQTGAILGQGTSLTFLVNTFEMQITAITVPKGAEGTYAFVQFLDADGEVISTKFTNVYETIVFPTAPDIDGKEFVGWDMTQIAIRKAMATSNRIIVRPVYREDV